MEKVGVRFPPGPPIFAYFIIMKVIDPKILVDRTPQELLGQRFTCEKCGLVLELEKGDVLLRKVTDGARTGRMIERSICCLICRNKIVVQVFRTNNSLFESWTEIFKGNDVI